MKLKHNLCNDYIKLPESMRTILEQVAAQAWLAGFHASREKSAEIFRNSPSKFLGWTFHEAFRQIQQDLDTLGEEEV